MESKPLYKSLTILGALLAGIAAFAPAVGIDFNQADANVLMANVHAIVEAVGLIMVVIGRVRATGPLTLGGQA